MVPLAKAGFVCYVHPKESTKATETRFSVGNKLIRKNYVSEASKMLDDSKERMRIFELIDIIFGSIDTIMTTVWSL
jgi:hypothetical protein